MLKKYMMSLMLASMGLGFSTAAIADGANIHVVGGISLAVCVQKTTPTQPEGLTL